MNDVVKQTSVPNNNKNPHKSNSKKRKPKEVALFGNYKNYYGYRIGQELEEDPRVKVFRKEWFEGKDCLDIGCNSGLITINIAKKFSCRSILGVDIDTDRIEEAYWNLRRIVRESTSKPPAKASRLKDAKAVEVSDHCVTESPTEQKGKAGEGLSPCNLSERVSFRRENFVQSRISDDKRYHTIMCLSVTKWIHLNWGDEGLINLFTKIWKLLQPGGMLILEPQPWSSYAKNHKVSEGLQSLQSNISSISLSLLIQ
nr:PREDICTED: probable RNA methyltransferase At5g51130 isoform X3 [Daucus carota subsp. sativus]